MYIYFFSCACVVFHIVMEQQWGEGEGGEGGRVQSPWPNLKSTEEQ